MMKMILMMKKIKCIKNQMINDDADEKNDFNNFGDEKADE